MAVIRQEAAKFGLTTPVTQLSGIGPRQAQKLERLGIRTVRDLLFHLPRRYEDTRRLTPLAQLEAGEVQTSQGRIFSVESRRSPRKRMDLVEARIEDNGEVADAIWFNQRFLAQKLQPGMEVLLSGKVERSRGRLVFRNPKWEPIGHEQLHVGRLAPVYPETEGLTSRFLRARIEPLLALTADVPDAVPPQIREREALLQIGEALRQVHFPDNESILTRARERVAFEELFLLQVAGERARRRRQMAAGVVIPYDVETAQRFVRGLPFRLTDWQRIAAHQILSDMAEAGVMNRLLQGDVGSGKTVVAAMAALMASHAGAQIAFMAPTEILARQHYGTLEKLLAPLGVAPRLLVGSTSMPARREIVSAFASGNEHLLVGTHALLEDDVVLPNLGLVIVDEQHRFGVEQRQRLRLKSASQPNFLAMTATPIPRSLTLTLYGDVDLSEIRELPPGRQKVETQVVPAYNRALAYDFVRMQVKEGRQVFVICPLIEDSDKLGVRSATAEYQRLSTEVFPDIRMEMLHGRMAAREKEERMAAFVSGEVAILVSTTVVEVGVDVPNATVMLVEGAERFGLAQLHQLRGRVGRSEHKSYCLLLGGGVDEDAAQRLEVFASTDNGFDIAEADLRLRGPGDVVGLRQHGLPEMRVADLLDVALARRAKEAAVQWLEHDPDLAGYPPLNAALAAYRAVFDLD